MQGWTGDSSTPKELECVQVAGKRSKNEQKPKYSGISSAEVPVGGKARRRKGQQRFRAPSQGIHLGTGVQGHRALKERRR